MRAYTVEQLAEMLHVGRDKIYYRLRTGQLRSIKIGKLRRITEQQLAEFIRVAAWRPRTSGRGGNAAPPSRVSRLSETVRSGKLGC